MDKVKFEEELEALLSKYEIPAAAVFVRDGDDLVIRGFATNEVDQVGITSMIEWFDNYKDDLNRVINKAMGGQN